MVDVDAEHEVEAALEIEAEIDGLLGWVEQPRADGDDHHDQPDAKPEVPAHQEPDSLSP